MPNVARTNDLVVGICDHGQKCCPHAVVGYHGAGSPDVKSSGRGVQRAGDFGTHTCPHCGVFMCVGRSASVLANGKGVARQGDVVTHFCGSGVCINGDPTVKAGG